MFLIFGWDNGTQRDLGPAIPVDCPNCHNKAYWHLTHHTASFCFMFIPIPTENRWCLQCSVCSRGMELEAEDIPFAKSLAEKTQQFLAREIELSEYMEELESCSIDLPWATPDDPPVVALPEADIEPLARKDTWQCPNCGEDSPSTFDTCWNCGAECPSTERQDDEPIGQPPSEVDKLAENETNPFGTMKL